MKSISMLLILILLSSCSSLRKSFVYGGITGGVLGATAGNMLSPNKESISPNMAIWGGLGALIGAGLGYFFWKDDPENKELPSMMIPMSTKMNVPTDEYEKGLVIPSSSKKYKVENGPVPEYLQGKVSKPYVIEHVIPERTEKLINGKSITIESHKAWEVTFE
jgi:hypothetical protein